MVVRFQDLVVIYQLITKNLVILNATWPPFLFQRFTLTMKKYTVLLILLLAAISQGKAQKFFASSKSDASKNVFVVDIVHFNDVYEITPSGTNEGGLARVSTIYKNIKEQNPNTYLMLMGDFFSPSALSTAKVEGKRLDGRQMVDVLNTMKVDYVTFGNHEFDYKEEVFKERMAETKAQWISSNVFNAVDAKNFPGVKYNKILEFKNELGKELRIGIFAVTIDSNAPPYVRFMNYMDAAKLQVAYLRPKVDVLIAMTHLTMEEDLSLVEQFPEIDLIMGGHEHQNIVMKRGAKLTPICKADANVKTIFQHHLEFDLETRRFTLDHSLKRIDQHVPEDPEVKKVVDSWVSKAYSGFKNAGFFPDSIVCKTTEPLDGLESSVRNKSTMLTTLLGIGMFEAVPNTDAVIYNSGSIRIDDVIPPGTVTQYDVIRVLPFGGNVVSTKIKGALLKKVLDAGNALKGKGGFLQHYKIGREGDNWVVKGQIIDENLTYDITMPEFLAMGNEKGIEFLKEEEGVFKITSKHGDVRNVLIDQLQRAYTKR